MLGEQRHIALVAHDNKKLDLLNWADFNRADLMISSPLLGGPYERLRPDYGDVPSSILAAVS